MSNHIQRIRAFTTLYEQYGGHATPEMRDAMALLGDYERLQAELAEARWLLIDLPWNVVEAAEVDEAIGRWVRKRDRVLYGGAAEEQP